MQKLIMLALILMPLSFANANPNHGGSSACGDVRSYEQCTVLPNGDVRVDGPVVMMADNSLYYYSAVQTKPDVYCSTIAQMRRHVQMRKQAGAVNQGRVGLSENGDLLFLESHVRDDVIDWIVCTNRP